MEAPQLCNRPMTAAAAMAAARNWSETTTAEYAGIIEFLAARGFIYFVQPRDEQVTTHLYGVMRDASVIILSGHPKRSNLTATTLSPEMSEPLAAVMRDHPHTRTVAGPEIIDWPDAPPA